MTGGVRWTEEDLKRHQQRDKSRLPSVTGVAATGYMHGPKRGMNKTEAEYGLWLEYQKRDGVILEYRFESIKLRLANATWYTPDFAVYGIGGEIGFHEVKGFWRDDARIKFKVAAEQYPRHTFVAVQKLRKKQGGGWKVEVLR